MKEPICIHVHVVTTSLSRSDCTYMYMWYNCTLYVLVTLPYYNVLIIFYNFTENIPKICRKMGRVSKGATTRIPRKINTDIPNTPKIQMK